MLLKWSVVFMIISLFFITACSEKNIEAPSTTVKEDKVLQNIDNSNKENDKFTTTNQNTNTNNEETNSQEIHKAENLIRQYLELADHKDTIVEFDHEQNGKYVIHVFDIIDRGEHTEHFATRGWYLVDLDTEDIEVLQ